MPFASTGSTTTGFVRAIEPLNEQWQQRIDVLPLFTVQWAGCRTREILALGGINRLSCRMPQPAGFVIAQTNHAMTMAGGAAHLPRTGSQCVKIEAPRRIGMMRLSDEELEALLSDIESDRAERKESAKGDAPEKLWQAICAFANDLPGHDRAGVAFVGAKDDGSPAALSITDELLRTLADMRSDARFHADLIVFDVGPNLGAINRAALLASNHVIVPLGADLFSLQGLRNLGPTLRDWRAGWEKRRNEWAAPEFTLPPGDMVPTGYVAMRHGVRLTRPVKAYTRWLEQIPAEFRHSVLGEEPGFMPVPPIESDPYCLAMLKNYNSLMPTGAGGAQADLRPAFGRRCHRCARQRGDQCLRGLQDARHRDYRTHRIGAPGKSLMTKQKLELTWIGKEKRPKLEPRIVLQKAERSYEAAQRGCRWLTAMGFRVGRVVVAPHETWQGHLSSCSGMISGRGFAIARFVTLLEAGCAARPDIQVSKSMPSKPTGHIFNAPDDR